MLVHLRSGLAILTVFAVALVQLPRAVLAGTPSEVHDHLKCYKFQTSKNDWGTAEHAFDSLTLSAELTGLEEGCVLLPKKSPRPNEICVPVVKSPNEGEGPPLDPVAIYACYRMECPSGEDLVIDEPAILANQFGGGQGTIKLKPTVRRLCVPSFIALP